MVTSSTDRGTSSAPAALGIHTLARKTDHDLELIAQKVLAHVKDNVVSSHTIIPRWDYLTFEYSQRQENYQKFGGEALLRLIRYQRRLTNIRNLAKFVTSQINPPVKYGITATAIAISKFGIGECEETTRLAMAKCNVLGLTTILVLAESVNPSNPASRHFFFLLGVNGDKLFALMYKYQRDQNQFIQVLKCLDHGVLVDPFLNVVCQLREFSTKGTALLQYARTFDLSKIHRTMEIREEDFPGNRQALAEAEEIYKKAQEILAPSKEIPTSQHQQDVQIVSEEMERWTFMCLMEEIIVELNKISPKPTIPWKKNAKENCIWIEGAETDIRAVAEHFQKMGIENVVNRNKPKSGTAEIYSCFIKNPSLDQLRKITSPITSNKTEEKKA